jgi:hypothetical protein
VSDSDRGQRLNNDTRASADGLRRVTRIQVGNQVYCSGVLEDRLHCKLGNRHR